MCLFCNFMLDLLSHMNDKDKQQVCGCMVVFEVNLVHGNSFSGNIQNKFSCKESLRERERT